MSVWTVILIIAVIAAIILGVLYFVGRKMQAKSGRSACAVRSDGTDSEYACHR